MPSPILRNIRLQAGSLRIAAHLARHFCFQLGGDFVAARFNRTGSAARLCARAADCDCRPAICAASRSGSCACHIRNFWFSPQQQNTAARRDGHSHEHADRKKVRGGDEFGREIQSFRLGARKVCRANRVHGLRYVHARSDAKPRESRGEGRRRAVASLPAARAIQQCHGRAGRHRAGLSEPG